MPEIRELPSTVPVRRTSPAGDEIAPTGGKKTYVWPSVSPSEPARPGSSSKGDLDRNALDESVIWKRRSDIREYPIEKDLLLFHPELQLLCRLNETGSFLWRNCEGQTIGGMADALQEHFAVEAITAREHVLHIVELFEMNRFVYSESDDATAR